MNIRNEVELEYTGTYTTELESYKQVEPRDGGRNLAEQNDVSRLLLREKKIEFPHVKNLPFVLQLSWRKCE